MNNVLISNKISNKISDSLVKHGFNVILLPDYGRLDKPVMSHADMLVYKVSENQLITYKEYYEVNRMIFDSIDCHVYVSDITPDKEYPKDISLNALKLGKVVFGREACIAKEICLNTEKIINVKQGYARCSCLQVTDNFVITADQSLLLALENEGINVLKISSGHIEIEQYDYGFIGGASFVSGDTVYFFGDINKHPDGNLITHVINSQNIKICCLSDDPLYDYGGAVII